MNALDIAAAVRKLFNIKRFASIEFSAKQAFDNLNMAMVLMQIFLFIAIAGAIYGLFRWRKYASAKNRSRRIKLALHRLADELVLVRHGEKVDFKPSIELIRKLAQENGFKRLLGTRYRRNLLSAMDLVSNDDISYDERIILINQFISALRDF